MKDLLDKLDPTMLSVLFFFTGLSVIISVCAIAVAIAVRIAGNGG